MLVLWACRRPEFTTLRMRHVANKFLLTDPFAEADDDTGEAKQSQNYIHIRIQRKTNPNNRHVQGNRDAYSSMQSEMVVRL